MHKVSDWVDSRKLIRLNLVQQPLGRGRSQPTECLSFIGPQLIVWSNELDFWRQLYGVLSCESNWVSEGWVWTVWIKLAFLFWFQLRKLFWFVVKVGRVEVLWPNAVLFEGFPCFAFTRLSLCKINFAIKRNEVFLFALRRSIRFLAENFSFCMYSYVVKEPTFISR